MNAEVTLEEAQRQLAKLLAQAAPGESFFISDHGTKLASVTKLPSAGAKERRETSLVELARSIRSRVKPGPDSIRELIRLGRP